MNRSFNLIDLINIILKRRKVIITIILVAAAAAVIVSLLMPAYYASKAIFYPLNLSITDRQMLFKKEGGDNAIEYFGSKNDINRILSIAEASSTLDFMINHFRLYEHYNIDTTDRYWRYEAKKELDDNYNVMKTELGAVEVTILDTDPALAATMVNLLVEFLEKEYKQVVNSSRSRITEVFRKKLLQKKMEVAQLTDSLAQLKIKYNIHPTINPNSDNLIMTGSDQVGMEQYRVLYNLHQNALNELTEISTLFDQYEVAAGQNVSSLYILEKAYPADRKSKPIRWLICLSVTLIAAFFAVIGVILAERIRLIRQELSYE